MPATAEGLGAIFIMAAVRAGQGYRSPRAGAEQEGDARFSTLVNYSNRILSINMKGQGGPLDKYAGGGGGDTTAVFVAEFVAFPTGLSPRGEILEFL